MLPFADPLEWLHITSRHPRGPRTARIETTNLVALASSPKAIRAAIEKARREKEPPLDGWLGMTVLQQPNWQMLLQLGDGVRQVEVHPRSSAFQDAGVRTGDFVRPLLIRGMRIPVDEFPAQCERGTHVLIEFYPRPGSGRGSAWLAGEAVFGAPPRQPAIPEWKRTPRIQCGERVRKKDRPEFSADMATHHGLTDAMFRCLTRLVTWYDGPKGAFPSFRTLGRDVGLSRGAVINIMMRLEWLGILKVASRGGQNKSNTYTIHWPANWVRSRHAASTPTMFSDDDLPDRL